MPIDPADLAKSIGTLTDLHPEQDLARGVPEVGRLSCCTFVFVDEAAEDVTAVELPRSG